MRGTHALRRRDDRTMMLSALLAGAVVLAGPGAVSLSAQTTLPDTMPRQTRPAQPGQPGGGAGLYRDLARGFNPITGVNPIVTEDSYGLRNALITGNVLDGRGFRGAVGYAGERDFRGVTGSEFVDDFLARAGAVSPAIPSFGLAHDRIRLGQDLGLSEYRRSGSGVTASDITAPTFVPGLGDVARNLRVEILSRGIMGRSLMEDFAEPIGVGVVNFGGEDGSASIELSGIRGVSVERTMQGYREYGLTFVDALSVTRDLSDGIAPGMSPHTAYRDLALHSGAPGRDAPAPMPRDPSDPRPVTSPVFLDLQRSILTRYVQAVRDDAADEATDPMTDVVRPAADRLQENLAALRALLAGGEAVDPDDPEAFDLEAIRKRIEDRAARDAGREPAEAAPDDSGVQAERFLRSALRHGRRLETLTDAEQSRYRELVAEGEELLGEEKYFRAERVFSRAMRLAPGHPLAMAGLVHSQLGAGLYLSAAVTLRALYASHPEMIDVRYAESLRPSDERLDVIRTDLRRDLARERNQRTAGLMLAYIGHLLESPDDIRTGLDAAASEDPQDALIELLRRIWL